MIRRIQRLKSSRGFSMIELIIVIAIIALMAGMVIGGSNNRRDKIREANSAATDFYSAIQAEFTNFQMFDGPLTMSLNTAYKNGVNTIGPNTENGGIKYYPAVGGNYPFSGVTTVGETHENGVPKDAVVYVEFYAYAGTLRRVNYANSLPVLKSWTGSGSGNGNAQLCLVLKQEMQDRMKYKDGYYYARISYTQPTGINLSKYDYRSNSVRVDWAVYTPKEITTDESTFFFKSQNMLRSGVACGVHTTTLYTHLGTTGTGVLT